MIKLHSCVLDLILNKWPKAESFIYTDVVIHDIESTITFQNQWFMTITASSCLVFVTIYRIISPSKNGSQGYDYITEYQVSRSGKDGKHTIRYLADKDTCNLIKVRWSTAELIAHIVLMIG